MNDISRTVQPEFVDNLRGPILQVLQREETRELSIGTLANLVSNSLRDGPPRYAPAMVMEAIRALKELGEVTYNLYDPTLVSLPKQA